MTERITCPCKGCGDRYSGCHAVCEAYLNWTAEMKKRKEAIYGDAMKEQMLNDFTTDGFRRVIRQTRRKRQR